MVCCEKKKKFERKILKNIYYFNSLVVFHCLDAKTAGGATNKCVLPMEKNDSPQKHGALKVTNVHNMNLHFPLFHYVCAL